MRDRHWCQKMKVSAAYLKDLKLSKVVVVDKWSTGPFYLFISEMQR